MSPELKEFHQDPPSERGKHPVHETAPKDSGLRVGSAGETDIDLEHIKAARTVRPEDLEHAPDHEPATVRQFAQIFRGVFDGSEPPGDFECIRSEVLKELRSGELGLFKLDTDDEREITHFINLLDKAFNTFQGSKKVCIDVLRGRALVAGMDKTGNIINMSFHFPEASPDFESPEQQTRDKIAHEQLESALRALGFDVVDDDTVLELSVLVRSRAEPDSSQSAETNEHYRLSLANDRRWIGYPDQLIEPEPGSEEDSEARRLDAKMLGLWYSAEMQ